MRHFPVKMKWLPRLVLAALAAVALQAEPLAAQSHLDSQGQGHLIGNCKNLTVKSAKNRISSREYILRGKCELKTSNSQDYETAEIKVVFHKSNNMASETISLPSFGGPFQLVVQCNEDPWLVASASCSKYSLNRASYPYGIFLMHDEFSKTDYPVPISRFAQPAVQNFIHQLQQPLPPKIVEPRQNKSYLFTENQSLLTVVEYAGAIEKQGAHGWYEFFTYPPGADTVALEWQRLRRTPGPGGASQPLMVWLHVDALAQMKINLPVPQDLQKFDEGQYRVRARHNLPDPAWPWSAWREFWIGDPVDYHDLRTVTIALPEKDAVIGADSTESLIPVDILVKYWQPDGNVPPPPTLPRKPVEIELGLYWPSLPSDRWESTKPGWGPDGQRMIYEKNEWETFKLFVDPALWRIRARYRVEDSKKLKAPWTPWRNFVVGPLPAGFVPPGDSKTARIGLAPAVQVRTEHTNDTGKTALDASPGSGAPAALKPAGRTVPATQTAHPPDPGRVGMKAAQLRSARLSVKRVAVNPSPLVAGSTLRLVVTLRNDGIAGSKPTDTLAITCSAASGGSCPVPTGTVAIAKVIPPGGEASVTLVSAKPAAAGEYRLSFAVPDQKERAWSMTLKVAAPLPVRRNLNQPDQTGGQGLPGAKTKPRIRLR